MKKLIWSYVVAGAVAASLPQWAQALPVHLRTNGLEAPLGMDAAQPTFSWRSDAKTPDWMQSHYEILVGLEGATLTPGKASVWDSGKVNSSESTGILYRGTPLKAQQRYKWVVLCWDKQGNMTRSKEAWFETGLLQPSDWKAEWIRREKPAADEELKAMRWIWRDGADPMHVPSATPMHFSYRLSLNDAPAAASLHVLARGSFVARVNGTETGHHDSWGAFDREEIASLLHRGDNEIEIDMVSPHAGGKHPVAPAALAASIHLSTAAGKMQRITTADGWKVRSKVDEAWADAHIVGPLQMTFGIGIDREEAISGPDRIETDASLFRKGFRLDASVKRARLTITALGAYQAFINGQAVAANTMLAPGWTDFHKRALYQTYDLTPSLHAGPNTLGIVLGGGWHSSPMTWSGIRYTPGPDLLRAQLDITLANGRHLQVNTDGSWKTAAAPVTFAEIYGGESYDARLEQPGWNANGFNDRDWAPATTASSVANDLALTAEPDLLINTVKTVQPVHVAWDAAHSMAIYDMGQNMVGVPRLHIKGRKGLIVKMRFAERLKPHGGIYTENLRNADATDTYVFRGEGEETWTPALTFHGFRYIELSYLGGAPVNAPTLQSVEGLVYNSLPAAPSVRLTSSSALLNKMNELGAWGQRGNFVSIPTDCPQRDERLGWMGDAGVFWRTGTYNFDIQPFTNKFMLDIVDAQEPSGAFTDISPNILGPTPGAPGWGDAGIFIPYAAWLQYGDASVVEHSWPPMQRWMAFIEQNNPDHLRRKALGNNFGDWLAPDEHTPRDLIGTAYWALCAREMAEMAKAIYHDQDAEMYRKQFDSIATAFRTAYVKSNGEVVGGTQTAYVATLFTGIAPPGLTEGMVQRVKDDLRAHGDHLTTGFLGTPFLLPVLDSNGQADLAFKLLLTDTFPSWGYMIKNGATTWWERWNGDTGDPGMNSYNHYAFGSVMSWVYRRAAGIDTDSSGAGFHHIVVQPHFDPALPQLHVEYDSAYGTIVSDWQQSTHRFTLTLPANTTATVTVPGNDTATVGSGTHSYVVRD